MSTTTTPTTPSAFENAAVEFLDTVPMLVGLLGANKAAGVDALVQAFAVKEDENVKDELDKMVAAIEAEEVSDPLLAKAISTAEAVLPGLGIKVNTPTAMLGFLKAAIDNLFAVIEQPAAPTPTPAKA